MNHCEATSRNQEIQRKMHIFLFWKWLIEERLLIFSHSRLLADSQLAGSLHL